MATITLSAESPTTLDVDALVVGLGKGPDGPVLAPGAEAVDEAFGGRLVEALVALGASGSEGEITRVPSLGATRSPAVVVVGLGKPSEQGYAAETLRRAAGAATRAVAGKGTVAVTLASAPDGPVRPVAEGSLLGAYAFRSYKQASLAGGKEPVREVVVVVQEAGDDQRRAVERAEVVARAVTLARDLVNTPPRDLPPAVLAQRAVDTCAPLGLQVEVLDEQQLADGGYGGILGVGQGSSRPPRLVRIAYRREGARRHVALVGKGITFDSGGLSLKPSQSMEWMKSDMAGAAAVIATMTAVAALEPDVDVTGWAPLAENMPSGTAIRPSDVLSIYGGGKKVEVLNTDAEGRLVLADAIVRACEESPDYLVDVATLTGAQLVALGNRTVGVMGEEGLRGRVVAAAERAGETMWPMPLPEELRKSIDSDVADIKNTGPREGGMLVAGTFLREFVADGVTWAHLDIAGPAFNQSEPHGYTPKGGTGVAVRTFLELLEDVARAG